MSQIINLPFGQLATVCATPSLGGTAQLTSRLPASSIVQTIENSFFAIDDTSTLESSYETALDYLNKLMDELYFKL